MDWHNKTANLEIFVDDESTVFIQTLNEMCSDMEMICGYENYVLRRISLLSSYWIEACNYNT